jgi:DNA-binding protein HU-beta
MNKADLVEAVARVQGIASKAAAERAVNCVFDTITKSLSQEEAVSIAGFGVFEVRTRKARMGRNPQTGAIISIPETKNAGFRAGKALKDSL